jgi:hypothetical protein
MAAAIGHAGAIPLTGTGAVMEVFPPPFNKQLAKMFGLSFDSSSADLGRGQVLVIRFNPDLIVNWFFDHIRFIGWNRLGYEANGGRIVLRYAESCVEANTVHMWVRGFFIMSRKSAKAIPKAHDLGTVLYFRAVPIPGELCKLVAYCYTPHLLSLYDALLRDANLCWSVTQERATQVLLPDYLLDTQPLSVEAENVPLDDQPTQPHAVVQETAKKTVNRITQPDKQRRRRGGPTPRSEKEKRALIEGWLKAKNHMTQEAYCHMANVGASTLRGYMRELDYPSESEGEESQAS